MFMALLSPWSYFGRETNPPTEGLWVRGPSEGYDHWPAFAPDSRGLIPSPGDLWRAHVRNIGGA